MNMRDSVGKKGYCNQCEQIVPDGPDTCLGYIDGISWACCGHGDDTKAYVCFGEYPNGGGLGSLGFIPLDYQAVEGKDILRGQEALDLFASLELGPKRG